jgi:hypothetical protein
MSNRHMLFCLSAFALVVSFSGAALADAVGVTSSTSKLKCQTVQETQCTADAHGHISNCHTVPVYSCTVVSGPGSGVSSIMGGNGPSVGPKGNLFHPGKPLGAVRLTHRR